MTRNNHLELLTCALVQWISEVVLMCKRLATANTNPLLGWLNSFPQNPTSPHRPLLLPHPTRVAVSPHIHSHCRRQRGRTWISMAATLWSGKRGHNARNQARNSRGQLAPARKVVLVVSDSDDDVNPAAVRLELEVRSVILAPAWSNGLCLWLHML